MSRPVTLTFTSPGAKPPIYVAGSFTRPPWTAIEMDQAEDAPNGDPVFIKTFDDVETGEYQYKYRLGNGDWWMLNEKVETATDTCGNRNNILRVFRTGPKPPVVDESSSRKSVTSPSTEFFSQDEEDKASVESSDLTDEGTSPSTTDPSKQTPVAERAPIPFTVVEMAPDIARPEYGDIASAKLNEDSGKRESDADPDTEIHAPKESLPDSHADPPRRFSVPTLVVERTDDSPRYGDDFGRRASLSQRVAHELRAADAQPDQTIILPLKGEESDTSRNSSEDDSQRSIDGDSNNEEDEPAPLFRHETIATKSEVEDEVEPAPLFRHETIATGDVSQADVADYDEEEPIPLFRHETIPDHQDPTAFRRHSTHIEVPESPFTPGSSVEDVNENIRDTARNPDPVRVDDGMPLFSHECVPDEQGSRSMSQMSGRSKSGTSLQRIAEDPDDTPVEEFPTDKAEIVGKLQETKRRLSRDDSPVDENTSPSPIRPGASPRVSNYSAEAPSPLEPISEDVAVEDEEPLDSVPLSLSDPDLKLKTSEVREIALATPPETPVDVVIVSEDELSAPDKVTLEKEVSKSPVSTTELATTTGAHEGCTDESHSMHRRVRRTTRSTSPQSHDRAATPSSVRSAQIPQQNSQEGFLAAFWRVVLGGCIGPIGRWLSQIFGSRRNATISLSTIAGITVALVAVAYLPT